jgi:hypothetical protein
MPKGGRTGGAVFPRVDLEEALKFVTKLVNKTHSGPQSQDIIFSAVVGAKSGLGEVRISSLKQYGFLEGTVSTKFSASGLAKQIVAAPHDELLPLYQKAILTPTIFKKLFDTFHSDTFAKGKIKQRAAELNVHPSQTETCVKNYIQGMQLAGLVSVDGDQITHINSNKNSTPIGENEQSVAPDEGSSADGSPPNSEATSSAKDLEPALNPQGLGQIVSSPKAIFNVNVTIDSSFDIDKLRQHLELLKQFGAI